MPNTTISSGKRVVYDENYEPELTWMETKGQWGMRAEPGKHGLTLEDIALDSYGTVPESSSIRSGRQRGSASREWNYRSGAYHVNSKQDVWLKNAGGLYEEALQRQWSSATDIPWETIEPLPDDIERAACQFTTYLSEIEFVAADVPGRWVAGISPDYLETRMFLMTQMMDEARHLDVFRKRALANGGGLMRAGDDFNDGAVSLEMLNDFSEMSARLHVAGESPVLTIFRTGELLAQNEAEKRMYRLAAQDESRHVAFGIMHLRYIGQTEPERREEMQTFLDEGEMYLFGASAVGAAATDMASTASMAVLLGGGKDNIDEGWRLMMAINRRQMREWVQRVKSAGFEERFTNGRANPEILKILRN